MATNLPVTAPVAPKEEVTVVSVVPKAAMAVGVLRVAAPVALAARACRRRTS
jgi:hypothetical protein